jgi:peroxiredoxin
VCLTVEGTQIGKGAISGQDQTSCSFNTPDWMVATLPAWWVNIMLPVWGPDPGPEGILADHIIAHISVPSRVAPSAETGTAAIVHFAGDSSMVPLPVLGEALLASRLRDAEVPVIVVLPRGSFGQPKARVEARLGLFPRELSTPLAVTEDYEGGWTNAFKAPAGPITYFMSASGDLPWQEAGAPRAQALTAALDQHGSAGRRGRATLMRLRVRPGDPAPDLFIEDESPRQRRADRMLPPRLCGQRTLLLFWKSWSRPCLTELRRLQQVNSETSGEGPVIVAVGDGEPPERVRTIAQEHGLGFRLLPDPTSQLARRYRVACWPTAVWIDEQAFIERVHFGVTPDRSRTA